MALRPGVWLPRSVGTVAAIAMLLAACSAATEITSAVQDPGPVSSDITSSGDGNSALDTPPPSGEVPGADDAGAAGEEAGADGGGVDGAVRVELSGRAVYESIQNSVVYLEAPNGGSSGSGIVIEGGWILTNAHVVERFEQMRLGRSDGVDLGLFPVHALDWVFDLAIIGPVDDDSLVPVARGESGALGLGSRVLLVGFPDEDSSAPTPTVTEGIVSRRRTMALGNYPFLQVDATIAPGQSGGALINGNAELVGISGLEFGAGEFGLAFASDPMWPRVEAMLDEPMAALPNGDPVFELNEEIGPRRNFSFTVEVDESRRIDVTVESDADVFASLQTLGGAIVNQFNPPLDPFRSNATDAQLYFDEQIAGGEIVNATVAPGTYQIVVGSFEEGLADLKVTSSNELRRFVDAEEGAVLSTTGVVEGQLDWSRDSDRWELPLTAGDDVEIVVDSIADMVFAVRLADEVVATNDDAGLGLFGEGGVVNFTATESGTYVVEIGTFDTTRWGYLVQVTIGS